MSPGGGHTARALEQIGFLAARRRNFCRTSAPTTTRVKAPPPTHTHTPIRLFPFNQPSPWAHLGQEFAWSKSFSLPVNAEQKGHDCGWPVRPAGQLGGLLRAGKSWNLICPSSANLLPNSLKQFTLLLGAEERFKHYSNCNYYYYSNSFLNFCGARVFQQTYLGLGFFFFFASTIRFLGPFFHFTAPILPLQPPRCAAVRVRSRLLFMSSADPPWKQPTLFYRE